MKKLVTLLLLLVSLNFCYAQQSQVREDSVVFSEQQVLKMYNTIQDLQIKDSLYQVRIENLEQQVEKYEQVARKDSMILALKNEEVVILNQRVELYIDQLEVIRPKWYDNKTVSFFLGASTIILSSWVVNNTIQ